MSPTPEDIATRRRRLLWRATHRGNREMDLVLGGYVRTHIDALTVPELDELEAIVHLEDPMLMSWVVGREPVPAEHDTPLVAKILAFRPEVF
jgi:antitoxin CptB